MGDDVPVLAGAMLADWLASLKFPVAGAAGAGIGIALAKLLQGRAEEARTILLEEIRSASRPPRDSTEADEFIAITYRYFQAATEGAARLNLRLMAKVIKGQIEKRGLYASEFLRLCPILASLSREEVIYLATLHRLTSAFRPTSAEEAKPHGTDKGMQDALVPDVYASAEELHAAASALLRTGFLTVYSGFGNLTFQPSPLMIEVAKFAVFDV